MKQHTHFFDNVAKQHTHFFGMPHPFFETLAMSLRWDVKLLLNKSWPLLFYLWSSDGEPEGEGGFYVDDWMSFPVEPYLCVRGGQPFFLTLKGGVKHFFWLIQGGVKHFFHIFVIFHNDETIFLLLGPLHDFSPCFFCCHQLEESRIQLIQFAL